MKHNEDSPYRLRSLFCASDKPKVLPFAVIWELRRRDGGGAMELPRVERQILLPTPGVPGRSKLRRRRKVQICWQRPPYAHAKLVLTRSQRLGTNAPDTGAHGNRNSAQLCVSNGERITMSRAQNSCVVEPLHDTRSIFLFNFAQVEKHYGERRRHWGVDTAAGSGKTGLPQH